MAKATLSLTPNPIYIMEVKRFPLLISVGGYKGTFLYLKC